jgi:hypothetical protein
MHNVDQPIQLAAAAGSVASTVASVGIDSTAEALTGVPVRVILAAFGGALFGLSLTPPGGLMRAGATVVLNTFAGVFGTPLAAHVFAFPDRVHPGVALIIGAAAQILLGLFLDWARRKFGAKR